MAITKSPIKLEFEAAMLIGKQLMALVDQGRSILELAKRPVAKKEDERHGYLQNLISVASMPPWSR